MKLKDKKKKAEGSPGSTSRADTARPTSSGWGKAQEPSLDWPFQGHEHQWKACVADGLNPVFPAKMGKSRSASCPPFFATEHSEYRALLLKASAEQEQQCPVPAQRTPGQNAASPGALARAPLELLLKSCEEFLLVLHKYLESILRLPWLKHCLIKKKKILTRQILQSELLHTINWPADIFYIRAL